LPGDSSGKGRISKLGHRAFYFGQGEGM
jgi:hypothetical protein